MSEKNTILLAEDDQNLGGILKSYLEAKGYSTNLSVDGKEALENFKRGEFGFCILDVMMPVMDGFTLAKEIRKIDKDVPILFLTAKAMQEDKIMGFEVGADDYLTKPFSMEELLMRIKAILRRYNEANEKKSDNSIFEFGNYTFDYNRQILLNKKKEQKIVTSQFFSLLQ